MTTEVQEVNKMTKKEKLKVKHQDEGIEKNLDENERKFENKEKSKKNKKKKGNTSQGVGEEQSMEIIENTKKEKREKRQLEGEESTSKKKKQKKNKKNKDDSSLSTGEKNSQTKEDSIANEIEDEDENGEEKPKKEPSKRQLKREKAAFREAETKEAGKQGNAKKALNYVSMWKHAKSEWKFNKVVQTWLINNLLDENYVPDDHYPTVLEYFEGSKGSARKQLIDKAMAVIKKVEEQVEKNKEEDETEDKDEEIVETTEYKRARQLLQALPTET